MGIFRQSPLRLPTLPKMALVPKMHEEEIVYERRPGAGTPLVMLFGWAGCRDRYLTKYSAIYEERE